MASSPPASLSVPASPVSDVSAGGAISENNSPTRANENDAQLVVGAGRSLKNMLIDLMSVLENQTGTKIFIDGDFTLRVEGREAYTIKLHNEDKIEPSNLKISIDNASAKGKDTPISSTVEKRTSDHLEPPSDQAEALEPSSKRARTDEPPDAIPVSDHGELSTEQDPSDMGRIMSSFQKVSSQIKWAEECRRIADEAHDVREEKWRSSSATFHDDARKSREWHDHWMAAEMGWQRNMLMQLASDLKGLYPVMHSLKWETPPQPGPIGPTTMPLPPAPTRPFAPKEAIAPAKANRHKK